MRNILSASQNLMSLKQASIVKPNPNLNREPVTTAFFR